MTVPPSISVSKRFPVASIEVNKKIPMSNGRAKHVSRYEDSMPRPIFESDFGFLALSSVS